MDAQYFDTQTTNGSALFNTIPAIGDPVTRDALTPTEVAERVAWSGIRTDLVDHYIKAVTALGTIAEFLEQRVAPPLLSTAATEISRNESLADSRADRRYGPNMRVWEDFEQKVRDFSPDESVEAKFTETLLKSLNKQRAVKAERENSSIWELCKLHASWIGRLEKKQMAKTYRFYSGTALWTR
jgi:hypothetical protein